MRVAKALESLKVLRRTLDFRNGSELCRAASLESAAAVPPRTDTPCAETPYEAADIWRAERTHSARLASNVGLLGDGQSVIDLDTEIANRALDLGVTEQQLHFVARSERNSGPSAH